MSEDQQGSGRERAEHLQKAFEAAAPGLDLKLQPAGEEAPRCIGIAFMMVADVPFDIDDKSPIDHHDDDLIKQLIRAHESLSAQQYRQGGWRDYLLDTHMVVAKEGIIQTNQTVIDKWLDSPRFAKFQQEYPWKDPRDVQIRNVKIAFLGPQIAAATYRVTEKLANGKVIGGNAATLVARLEQVKWRGVVVTKGAREELGQADHGGDET